MKRAAVIIDFDASVFGTKPAAPAAMASSASARVVVPDRIATGLSAFALRIRPRPSRPFIPGML
jgi:hypothetical protein